MKVQDPAGKAADECRCQDGVIAGAHDQVDRVSLELPRQSQVACLSARIVLAKQNGSWDGGAAGMIQPGCQAVRAHDHNPGRILRFGRRINQGFEVASSPRNENSNAQPDHAEM